jgi:hypothetical protein
MRVGGVLAGAPEQAVVLPPGTRLQVSGVAGEGAGRAVVVQAAAVAGEEADASAAGQVAARWRAGVQHPPPGGRPRSLTELLGKAGLTAYKDKSKSVMHDWARDLLQGEWRWLDENRNDSNKGLAGLLGVSDKTVGRWRKEKPQAGADEAGGNDGGYPASGSDSDAPAPALDPEPEPEPELESAELGLPELADQVREGWARPAARLGAGGLSAAVSGQGLGLGRTAAESDAARSRLQIAGGPAAELAAGVRGVFPGIAASEDAAGLSVGELEAHQQGQLSGPGLAGGLGAPGVVSAGDADALAEVAERRGEGGVPGWLLRDLAVSLRQAQAEGRQGVGLPAGVARERGVLALAAVLGAVGERRWPGWEEVGDWNELVGLGLEMLAGEQGQEDWAEGGYMGLPADADAGSLVEGHVFRTEVAAGGCAGEPPGDLAGVVFVMRGVPGVRVRELPGVGADAVVFPPGIWLEVTSRDQDGPGGRLTITMQATAQAEQRQIDAEDEEADAEAEEIVARWRAGVQQPPPGARPVSLLTQLAEARFDIRGDDGELRDWAELDLRRELVWLAGIRAGLRADLRADLAGLVGVDETAAAGWLAGEGSPRSRAAGRLAGSDRGHDDGDGTGVVPGSPGPEPGEQRGYPPDDGSHETSPGSGDFGDVPEEGSSGGPGEAGGHWAGGVVPAGREARRPVRWTSTVPPVTIVPGEGQPYVRTGGAPPVTLVRQPGDHWDAMPASAGSRSASAPLSLSPGGSDGGG